MIREHYKFKVSTQEANNLKAVLNEMYCIYGNTKELELMLPLVALLPLYKKLNGMFMQTQYNIKLNRTQAIAFVVLYRSNLIELTAETNIIFTTIDRSI